MKYIILFVLAFVHSNVYAELNCNINSISDFYKRLLKEGPIKESSDLKFKELEVYSEGAKQRPNPELDFEYLRGDEFGIGTDEVSLSLKHKWELGSKYSKRVEFAKNKEALEKRTLKLRVLKEVIDGTIAYQRIAQLNVKIDSVTEAISTFRKIVKKLNGRQRLNPEETISTSTLSLALSDYIAKLNDYENERELLLGRVGFLAGCPVKNFTYTKLNYSKLETVKKTEGLIALETLKSKVAESELGVQNSLGYSDIMVGPIFTYSGQGQDEFYAAGIGVTFDLPLFQTNSGNKLKAAKALAYQKFSTRNNQNELEIRKENLISKYNRSLKTLDQMPSLNSVERSHQKAEKLFARGVVSISMTIESHRQLIDFLHSKFETENDLLDTIGRISIISGDFDLLKSLL